MGSFLKTFLYFLAPVVYILVVGLSLFLTILQFKASSRRGSFNIGSIAAFLAGWVLWAFVAVLVIMGQLRPPSIPTNLSVIFFSGLAGFSIGVGYLWLAERIIDSQMMEALFIIGSVGGSLVSFFFYVMYLEVQVIAISSSVAFLFGALLYFVFMYYENPEGIKKMFGRRR